IAATFVAGGEGAIPSLCRGACAAQAGPLRPAPDALHHAAGGCVRIATMNTPNMAEYTEQLGLQAKTASALMACAPAAIKNKALRSLARLLRESGTALAAANAQDLAAAAPGLAAPMVD